MSRFWKRVTIAFSILSLLLAATVVTLVLVRRARTGTWAMPNLDDIRAVRTGTVRAAKRVADQVLDRGPKPARTIYMVGGGIEITAGTDDAPRAVSSVLKSGTKTTAKVPRWTGSKKSWTALVSCIRDQFKDFNVVVTDERPETDDFVLAIVGGRAKDIGVTTGHVSGLAPYNGDVIPKPVVFAFSRTLGNRVQATCETLTMEIAHAYGLDHAYHCPDVMTYLSGCGKKRFRDVTVACGEKKKRPCKDGKPTQNSVQRLLAVLGPAVPTMTPTAGPTPSGTPPKPAAGPTPAKTPSR